MLMPSVFRESLFDDFFNFPSGSFAADSMDLMKTDVRESEKDYEITMNLPGVKKEDVKAELKQGYLTIHASSENSREEKDGDGKYIRRERHTGSCSRSFYVGEGITEEDIKARFEDGTLRMVIPKKEQQPAVEKKKYIAIEG